MALRISLPIRFGDCDSAGIVYYPRFFHLFHQAMEEFFGAAAGVPYPRLIQEHGLGFPAVRVETDFRRPVRYGDRLAVEVAVVELGASSCVFRFRAFVGDETAPRAEAQITTVCVDLAQFRKRPLPGWLRERLTRGGESEIEPGGEPRL